MPHTEDAEEEGERVVFWVARIIQRVQPPTTTTLPVPQNLNTLLLKQQAQAVNDRIPAKGCRHLLVIPRANGTGKLCGAIINDKGEIRGTGKSIQRKLVNDEGKRHSSRKVEGRTELDLVQDEVDEAKRLLAEAQVENKVTEAVFRVGQAIEEMRKLLEANSEPVNQERPEEDKSHVGKMVWSHPGGGEIAEPQGHHSTMCRFL